MLSMTEINDSQIRRETRAQSFSNGSLPNSTTSPRSQLTKTFKSKTVELQKAALPYDPWVVLQGPSNRGSPRSRSQSIVIDIPSPMNGDNANGDNDDDLLPSEPPPPPPPPSLPPSLIRKRSPRNDTSLNAVRSTTETLEHVIHVLSSPLSSQHKNKDTCMTGGAMSNGNADSFSKLHTLCSSNSGIEMIRIYASTYPWALKQRDLNGDLPLHVAIKRDDPSHMIICELLRTCPETAQMKDINGDLPLFLACRRPKMQVGILKSLLQVYPAAARLKSYGNTALHHLLHTGCATPENVHVLMSYFPEAVVTTNNFGNLPLHYLCASERPHLATVRTVLSAYPAGITFINKSGETPIERALGKKNDEEMRERVRIMLRASCTTALNDGQKQLLRQLNWEARRVIILLCVELARRNASSYTQEGMGIVSHDDQEEKIIRGDRHQKCKGLMDMYLACDGVWRYIIAYL